MISETNFAEVDFKSLITYQKMEPCDLKCFSFLQVQNDDEDFRTSSDALLVSGLLVEARFII